MSTNKVEIVEQKPTPPILYLYRVCLLISAVYILDEGG